MLFIEKLSMRKTTTRNSVNVHVNDKISFMNQYAGIHFNHHHSL